MDSKQPSSQAEHTAPQNQSEQNSQEDTSKNSDADAIRAQFEAYKKAKTEEIEKLKSENEELKKQPASSTSSVVEDSKQDKEQKPLSAVEEFVKTTSSAKELFDSLP